MDASVRGKGFRAVDPRVAAERSEALLARLCASGGREQFLPRLRGFMVTSGWIG